MQEHAEETTLHALLDDELAPADRKNALAHVERCAACASELAALRSLRDELALLPRGMAPARDLLAGIHERIDASAVVPLRADAVAAGVRRAPLMQRTVGGARRELAVAAAALIVLSSAVTALLLDRRADDVVAAPVALAPAAAMNRVEARFVSATEELERVLDAERASLSPETVRILETNLAIIDAALAEGRAALRADPGNPALSEILMATWEKKLDLLRRAASSVTT